MSEWICWLDLSDDFVRAVACEMARHGKLRDRVVRCANCSKSVLRNGRFYCTGKFGYTEVRDGDFCSYGEERES